MSIKRWCHLVLVFIFGAAVGTVVSNRYWNVEQSSIYNSDAGLEYEQFQQLAKDVKNHIEKEDGWIAADLQLDLVQSGSLDSVQAFSIGESTARVNNYELPARLNTAWAKNKKGVLLLVARPGERWVLYTDGTITRESAKFEVGQGSFTFIQNNWVRSFRTAGYPYWSSLRHKQKWLEANRERIVWSEEHQMYEVPQHISE